MVLACDGDPTQKYGTGQAGAAASDRAVVGLVGRGHRHRPEDEAWRSAGARRQ